MLHSLQNDKFLDWIKLKTFAVNKFIVSKMIIYVSDRLEKIVGKEENAGYQHFLLFLQCLQKPSFFWRVVKIWDSVVKSKYISMKHGIKKGIDKILLVLQLTESWVTLVL